MSTTTITSSLAANAAVQSSLANQQLQDTNARYCANVLITYNSNTASVANMQEYSSCVQYLYPSEEPEVTVPGKVIVGSLLLVLLISVLLCLYRKEWDVEAIKNSWDDVLFAPMIGFFAWMVGWGFYFGIGYLFS